jgi:carboxyl-terminal processing protease
VINGDEGTVVDVSLRRPGADDPVEATIRRERVVPPNIESRVIDATVGYVRIRHFTDLGVKEDLQRALEAFDTQGVASWIIDLRGNPGGRLDTPAISLFVRDGVVVRNRGRNGAIEEERATGDLLTSIRPTVLLTNNRTGSVSEIFAAALKEYGVARTVGTNTNGCVGYTDVRELGDGSSLAVTTHVHLGPVSNKELNGVGVLPDLVVGRSENDIANARDPQLDAAVGLLRE